MVVIDFAAVLRILADFVRVASGEIKLKQSPWLTLETVANKPWVDLFQGLALYWLDERPGDRQIRRLSRHVDKAMKNGLDWYVGEATALLEVLGVDTGEIDYLCEDDPRQRLVFTLPGEAPLARESGRLEPDHSTP